MLLDVQEAPAQEDPESIAAEETADTNTDADATAEGWEEEQDAADGDLTSVAQLQQLTKVPGCVQQHLLPVCWFCQCTVT